MAAPSTKQAWTRRLAVLVVVLVVPMVAYTVYQFSRRRTEERLIRSIYDRQLTSILFSVNQYCWDLFGSWHTQLENALARARDNGAGGSHGEALETFLGAHPSLAGAVIECGKTCELTWRDTPAGSPGPERFGVSEVRIDSLLGDMSTQTAELIGNARKGYVRPRAVRWGGPGEQTLSFLAFPVAVRPDAFCMAGLFVEDGVFVDRVLARRLHEMQKGEFVFAVRRHNDGHLLYSTGDRAEKAFEKQESLWILPDLELLIRMQGTTLAALAARRTRHNLVAILLVNILFLAGLVYLLRNMATESALARRKTEFVANVSHELRTPLSLISMHAETLEMGRVASEDKRKHYHRIILNECRRLSQLVNTILDFYRIESDRKRYNFRNEDVTAVVDETLASFQYHLAHKGFELKREIEPDIPAIAIDRNAVSLALVNLLDNAIKYSNDTKEITVRLAVRDNRVELAISDRGIGIPASEHRRVFDKFHRVEDSLVHTTKGSGLGLSLVRHVAQAHEGEVRLESKPGQGSTFTLVLPFRHKPKAA